VILNAEDGGTKKLCPMKVADGLNVEVCGRLSNAVVDGQGQTFKNGI